MLAALFTDDELFGQNLDTYHLYQHMVPIEQVNTSEHNIAERDFAIVGIPQTLSAAIVADVQARWVAHYFAGDDMRLPGNRDATFREAAHLVAASLSRYGIKDGRQGTAMPLELTWYADLLIKDIKALSHEERKSRHPLRALSSDDFL
jgi:hypothetical protein